MRKYYITVLCGLFVAMQVVLGRILAIDVGFMRISFVFLPIALGGAIFGPLWNGLICVAADAAGFLLSPGQGPFFPGFTLSAFLTGFSYGFFLKSRIGAAERSERSERSERAERAERAKSAEGANGAVRANTPGTRASAFLAIVSPAEGPLSTKRSLFIRTFLAAFCVTMLIDAHMNTLWVSILYDRAYIFYYGTRIVKSLAMLPVHVAVFGTIWSSLGKYIESAVIPKIAVK